MHKTLMAATLALGVVGCVETAGTRITIDTRTGDAKVLECSSRLADRVQVRSVSYSDASEGIMRATVTIESTTHKRLDLQARMVWMDADGAEIDPDAKSFRAIVLDGMDTTTITGVAPNSRAVKAKIQIRETKTAE